MRSRVSFLAPGCGWRSPPTWWHGALTWTESIWWSIWSCLWMPQPTCTGGCCLGVLAPSATTCVQLVGGTRRSVVAVSSCCPKFLLTTAISVGLPPASCHRLLAGWGAPGALARAALRSRCWMGRSSWPGWRDTCKRWPVARWGWKCLAALRGAFLAGVLAWSASFCVCLLLFAAELLAALAAKTQAAYRKTATDRRCYSISLPIRSLSCQTRCQKTGICMLHSWRSRGSR